MRYYLMTGSNDSKRQLGGGFFRTKADAKTTCDFYWKTGEYVGISIIAAANRKEAMKKYTEELARYGFK